MVKACLRGSRWGRTLLLGGAFLALGVLVGGPGTPAAAQKAKPGQPSKKAPEPKAEKGKPAAAPQVFNDIMVNTAGGADQVAFINEQIEKGWADNKLEPAARCSDFEFIRRVSLDLIGRIAKTSEIETFMSDPPRERRSKLIERLLESEEFPNHFANLWTNMLLTRSAPKVNHDQMHLWLYEQFEKKDASWAKVMHGLITATGDTNENGAVNYILAHLGEEIKGDGRENGRYDMVPVTSRTTKLFLGLRVQCTQCHDHPFNDEWRQSHFWGVNAFFRQVDPSGRPGMMMKKGMAKSKFTVKDNTAFNTEGIVPYERRNGLVQFSKAVFLNGTKLSPKAANRREELAQFILKSEYFAKVMVNRTWGHFMGRAFTKDADDFGEHSPVSNPELLNKLAKDWATKYNHDPRALVRWVCNSKPYSLSSVANETNDKSDAEPFFSRMLLKAMTPEQLFESLMVATESKAAQSKDKRKEMREKWLSKLVVTFGDDEGSETTFNGTVVQALLMMNGAEINTAIMDKDNGTVALILKRRGITAQKAMHDLYIAALNRPPSAEEYSRILRPQMMNLPRLNRPHDRTFFLGFYQDLFWALLNSNEFILNH